MTITVANVTANSTTTFGNWISKTNILLDALSKKIVTVDESVTTGNAVVNGTIQTDSLFVDNIYGGAIGAATEITFS